MTKPEPDPRTDGVGDGGMTELPPPTEDELAAGLQHDEAARNRALHEFGP